LDGFAVAIFFVGVRKHLNTVLRWHSNITIFDVFLARVCDAFGGRRDVHRNNYSPGDEQTGVRACDTGDSRCALLPLDFAAVERDAERWQRAFMTVRQRTVRPVPV